MSKFEKLDQEFEIATYGKLIEMLKVISEKEKSVISYESYGDLAFIQGVLAGLINNEKK